MGHAKRLLQEEDERRYYQSDDSICSECFYDPAIKQFIEDNLSATECSICNKRANTVIAGSANLLMEYFLEKINDAYVTVVGNAPYDSETGKWLVDTYDFYDLVYEEFSDIADGSTLDWLYKRFKDDGPFCRRNWQVMTQGEALDQGWESFCDAVKYKTRFLFFPSESRSEPEHEPYSVPPSQMLERLGELILDLELIHSLPAGTSIYRARGHETHTAFTTAIELGPPPWEHAKTAGRMNAPGIVLCYAALDREAALAEATGDKSSFTVAEFKLLQDIVVIDFVSIPPVPSFFEGGPRETLSFLHSFEDAVSQPFEPDDRLHIEYVPTQVISEYLRHRFLDRNSNKVDGLLYRSAKTDTGINLALFMESEEVLGASSERIFPPAPKLELLTSARQSGNDPDFKAA